MNLPNKLVIIRLILIPFIFATVYIDSAIAKYVGFALLLIAISTDKIDGYLARKWKQETEFGAFFDPLVDKLLANGSFIIFAHIGLVPIYLVLLMVLRDFTMQGIRSRASAKGIILKCRWESKLKATFQVVTVVAGFMFLAVPRYFGSIGDMQTLETLITWGPKIMFGLMGFTVLFAYFAFIIFFRVKENRKALLEGI